MNFEEAINKLVEFEIDFILVGGVCAVLHGAPVSTFDIDVLYKNDPSNNRQILKFLISIDATFRGQGGRIIKPDISHLDRGGQLLFRTSLGDIDFLSHIGNSENILEYDYFQASCDVYELEDAKVRILNLESLIHAKELSNRTKDKLHLIHLYELKNLGE